MHGQSADQVFLKISPHRIRDDHHRKESDARGENQAVEENDPGGFFQIRKLRVLNFSIHLRHGFFAAHGEHRMSQADQDSDEADSVR